MDKATTLSVMDYLLQLDTKIKQDRYWQFAVTEASILTEAVHQVTDALDERIQNLRNEGQYGTEAYKALLQQRQRYETILSSLLSQNRIANQRLKAATK